MKKTLLLAFAALAFTSCMTPSVVTSPVIAVASVDTTPPSAVTPPAPVTAAPAAPLPDPAPAPVNPAFPLTVTDPAVVTVTLDGAQLSVTLAPGVQETWLRLLLPDGTVSPITVSPFCQCIGLSRALSSTLNISFLPGLKIQTAPTISGPFIDAAHT